MKPDLLRHLTDTLATDVALALVDALRRYKGQLPRIEHVQRQLEARKMLDDGRSRAEIAERLEREFSVSHRQALRDTLQALDSRHRTREP